MRDQVNLILTHLNVREETFVGRLVNLYEKLVHCEYEEYDPEDRLQFFLNGAAIFISTKVDTYHMPYASSGILIGSKQTLSVVKVCCKKEGSERKEADLQNLLSLLFPKGIEYRVK